MEIETKIRTLMDISPAVHDFMKGSEYFIPEEDSAGRTISDVYLDCMKIIFEELEQLGITSCYEDDILSDGYRNEAGVRLRKLFDPENLRRFISFLSEDERTLFYSITDESDPDCEYGILNILNFMSSKGINGDDFISPLQYGSDYQLGSLFFKLIRSALIKQPMFSLDTAETQHLVVAYLQEEFKHVANVKKAAAMLRSTFQGSFDDLALNARLSVHDRDLIYGSSLREAAVMDHIKKLPSADPEMIKMAKDFKMNHYKRNRHHMDYFEGKEEQITDVDLVEIAADRYEEQSTKDEYLEDVKKVFQKVNLSDEAKNKILEVANRLDLWE